MRRWSVLLFACLLVFTACGDDADDAVSGTTLLDVPGTTESLVDELPPEPQPVEWVTVEETGDEAVAAIVEGFLLDRGYQVRILSRHDLELQTTIGGLSTIEVQVPLDHLDSALEVLDALDDDTGEGEVEEATDG